MVDLIYTGMPISVILLLLFVYVLAVLFYGLTFFSRKKANITNAIQNIHKIIISKADSHLESIHKIDSDFLTYYIPELKSLTTHIYYLKLVVNVSPLLGLLGTVIGIIQSTNGIVTENPTVLLSGISHSLISTALGLCVSIPGICIYFLLRAKENKLVLYIKQMLMKG